MRFVIAICVTCFSLNIVSGCEENNSTKIAKDFFSRGLTHKKIDSNKDRIAGEFYFNSSNLHNNRLQIDRLLYPEGIKDLSKDAIPYIHPYVKKDSKNEVRVEHIDDAPAEVKNSYAQSMRQPFTEEIFPIIIYDISDNNRAFGLAKSLGVTYIHRYSMGISVDKDQSFFDRAADHGLKVMSNLRLRYWIEKSNGLDSLRAYVQHFKDHPALGFWYLVDEPDNKGYPPAKLIPFYEMIQKETPNVPVAIAHARSKHWYRYGEVQDILMYDNYPIQGEVFPKVRLNVWTNFTKKAINRGKKEEDIVVPILQIFNWKAMAKERKSFRGYAVEKLRYPNARELRYMSFSSIALGAQGLSFYSYYRSRMVDSDWAGRVLAPVIHEVKVFRKQIADAQRQPILKGEDEDFFLTLWTSEENIFIILVNASPNARQVRRSLGGILKTGKLEPWGDTCETSAVLMDGNLVVEQMEPWEVSIWRVL